MKYKMIKGIIQKSDFISEYEPKEFLNTLRGAEKRLMEAEAQKKIYDAKAENVRHFNPFVEKMEEEKRNAIWMYHENYVASIQIESMIKKLKKDIKGLKNEMTEITKQTGHKF